MITLVPIECGIIHEPSDCDKVIWAKVNMWWPLQHRDCVVSVFAYDCLNDYDSIIIVGKSVDKTNTTDDKELNEAIPEVPKRTVRMGMCYSTVYSVQCTL